MIYERLVRAFTATLNTLQLYEHRYICHALTSTYYAGSITKQEMHDAQAVIRDRLGPSHSLEEWLGKTVAGLDYNDLTYNHRPEMMTYRFAWLNELIDDFGDKVIDSMQS